MKKLKRVLFLQHLFSSEPTQNGHRILREYDLLTKNLERKIVSNTNSPFWMAKKELVAHLLCLCHHWWHVIL